MGEEKNLINGLEINYKIAGEGEPLLILHGWGGSSDSWIKVQRILAENGFKVICPDLPGFGKSETLPEPWTIKDYSDFILDLFGKFNLQRVFLLGHSFGGRIAIKFTALYPLKIKKLILVSSAGIKYEKTFWYFFISVIAKIGSKFSFLPFYSFFRKIFYKYILRKTDYLEAKGVLKETFKKIIEEDLRIYLPQIIVPTLIIWGKEDKFTPLSDAYLMKEKIKNSKLEILEKIGHTPHLENPQLLSKKIIDFLKTL